MKIWIASGAIVGDVLRLEDCRRAEVLPGSGRDRDRCLAALRHFISTQEACAVGLDFPFGLPSALVEANSWEQFVLSFGDRYSSAEQFKETCRAAARGRELRRVTDQESQTPLSPYNLRLYRQTYFGIRDVLAPLVRDRLACILPMQSAAPGRPWIFEVCPASTLKAVDLYLPYKGRGRERDVARARVLQRIEEIGALLVPASTLRSTILGDRQGDALDSVIAASATFSALRNLARSSVRRTEAYALEGYVYV